MTVSEPVNPREDLAVAVAEHHPLAVPERVVVVAAVVDGRAAAVRPRRRCCCGRYASQKKSNVAPSPSNASSTATSPVGGSSSPRTRVPGSVSRPLRVGDRRGRVPARVSATSVSPSLDRQPQPRAHRPVLARTSASVARAASAARASAAPRGGDPGEQVRGDDRVRHAPRLARGRDIRTQRGARQAAPGSITGIEASRRRV